MNDILQMLNNLSKYKEAYPRVTSFVRAGNCHHVIEQKLKIIVLKMLKNCMFKTIVSTVSDVFSYLSPFLK